MKVLQHPNALRIHLRDILTCVVLMPVWGMTAFPQLDCHLRTPRLLRLFGCPEGKKVVVSDTTIERVLSWIDPQESAKALLAPCAVLNANGLLQRPLMPNGPLRRVAAFDGSQMGHHYLVAALLCGKANYPVLVQPCQGRGHELKRCETFALARRSSTADLALDFEAARKAAHPRWYIENDEFKRPAHLAGTKTVHFKDPRPFSACFASSVAR